MLRSDLGRGGLSQRQSDAPPAAALTATDAASRSPLAHPSVELGHALSHATGLPLVRVVPGFAAQPLAQTVVLQQGDYLRGELGFVEPRYHRSSLRTDDILRPHDRGRHHRHTERHRLQQHEPLRFRVGGEYEDVACAIAVEQRLLAVLVADEQNAFLDAEPRRQAPQVLARRPFAGNHEQDIGNTSPHTLTSARSRKSMFFSNATRPTCTSVGRPGAMPWRARNAAPSPPQAASSSMPVGIISIGHAHAVSAQHFQHGAGGHHQCIEIVALVARETPCQRTHPRLRHERDVVVQVFLEQSVVGLHPRQTQVAATTAHPHSERRTASGCGSSRTARGAVGADTAGSSAAACVGPPGRTAPCGTGHGRYRALRSGRTRMPAQSASSRDRAARADYETCGWTWTPR